MKFKIGQLVTWIDQHELHTRTIFKVLKIKDDMYELADSYCKFTNFVKKRHIRAITIAEIAKLKVQKST